MTALTRRTLLHGSLAALAVPALAACGANAGTGPGGPAKSALRITWWGSEFYVKFTNEALDLYRAAHPDVTVSAEPSPWNGYWEKLATQMAAGDEPDVINMDLQYLAEYAGRGALADLEKAEGLDLSAMSEADKAIGRIDGKLNAALTGNNAYMVFANKALFTAAGVDIPDDKTWTWDQYQQIAQKITKSGAGLAGTSGSGGIADLLIFLRQHGQDMYGGPDGIGFTEATLADWFAMELQHQESGAGMSATRTGEEAALSFEQKSFNIGKAGMLWAWTNQLANARKALKSDDVVMLRPPSKTGKVNENGHYFKATMYWSISARSKNPKLAAQIVNFLLNDLGAGKVQGLNRGVPVNNKVLDSLKPNFTPTETYVITLMSEFATEITGKPPAVPPKGTSEAGAVITRTMTEVRFKRLTPQAAATKAVEEIKALIKNAR